MSLLAGVLSAALALPPQGLVAAYDFARTNFLNWSEDLTQNGWVRSSSSISLVGQQLADGSLGTVSKLLDTTANTQHLVSASTFIPADNTPQSFVWRVKAAEYQYVGVQWSNKANNIYPTNIVDLVAGVILNSTTGTSFGTTITTTSGGFVYTLTVVSAGNGWWDLVLSIPSVGAGSNSPRPALLLQNQITNANGFTFVGTGTSGVLIHRVQWNGTVSPLPYERTTDAQTLVDRRVQLQPSPLGRVNQLGFTEELNLAPWVLTNATLTPGVSDPFGGTRAFTLTGLPITSGPERRLLQNAPPATAGERRTNSVYLRRRTGTGTVQMLTPQNSAWGDLALTGAWQRFTTSGVLGTSSSLFALRLQVDSDQVDVAFPQQEAGSTPTAYERQFSTLFRDQSLKSVNMAFDGAGGSTAALPPGWAYGSEAGITHAITAVRPSNTVPGTVEMDFTVSNSDTVNRAFRIYPTPSANTAAGVTIVPGEVLSWSVYLSTPDSSSLNLGIYSHDTSHNFLANSGQTVATSTVLTKYSMTRSIGAGQATATARGVIEFSVGPGGSRSFTLAAPMFNRGPELPYVRPAQHATLGAGATPDSSDPTWAAQGLTFDGVDDRVITPIPPPGLRSFTVIVAALLRPGAATPNNYADAVGWRNAPARGWVNLNVATGAAANWEIRDGAATQVGSDVTNAGAIVQGQYAVYALSVDRAAGTARAFQNGVLTRTRTLTAGLGSIDADSTLVLGTTLTGGKTPLTLAHAAVYDRALTDAEVHQAYRFIRNQLSQRGITT